MWMLSLAKNSQKIGARAKSSDETDVARRERGSSDDSDRPPSNVEPGQKFAKDWRPGPNSMRSMSRSEEQRLLRRLAPTGRRAMRGEGPLASDFTQDQKSPAIHVPIGTVARAS